MCEVGIEEFIFVIFCGKFVFEDYFDIVFEFESKLVVKGKMDLLFEVEKVILFSGVIVYVC